MSIVDMLDLMESNCEAGAQSINSLQEQHRRQEDKAQATVEQDLSNLRECLNGLCALTWKPVRS